MLKCGEGLVRRTSIRPWKVRKQKEKKRQVAVKEVTEVPNFTNKFSGVINGSQSSEVG